MCQIFTVFILLLFWFQCFDSKSENYLYSSNPLYDKSNFGTLTPSHYCNVSNYYLTMEFNSSQPTVYCVGTFFLLSLYINTVDTVQTVHMDDDDTFIWRVYCRGIPRPDMWVTWISNWQLGQWLGQRRRLRQRRRSRNSVGDCWSVGYIRVVVYRWRE